MTLLPNVGEVVTNPDLQTAFQYAHRTQSISASRVVTITQGTPISSTGVIVPAKQTELKGLPEGTRVDDVIRIFTQTPIVLGDGISTQSDVILFEGRKWLVYAVNDWILYGFFDVWAVRNDLL